MNAKKFLNVRVCLTMTAVALCGALAMTASCASNGNNNGGATGSGGASGGGASGGGASGGGSTGTTANGDTVTFATGKASGPMTGYGWIALGKDDSVTSPTCDNSKNGGSATATIDLADPCNGSTNWSDPASLCISGSIPLVTGSPANYTDNWGFQIGINSSEPAGTAIAKSYSTITYNWTGAPSPTTAAMRAEIHVIGDDATVTWCANAVSGKSIPISSFSKTCWDGAAPATPLDASKIDKIGLQVSADINSAYTVSNLCLTSVQFGS